MKVFARPRLAANTVIEYTSSFSPSQNPLDARFNIRDYASEMSFYGPNGSLYDAIREKEFFDASDGLIAQYLADHASEREEKFNDYAYDNAKNNYYWDYYYNHYNEVYDEVALAHGGEVKSDWNEWSWIGYKYNWPDEWSHWDNDSATNEVLYPRCDEAVANNDDEIRQNAYDEIDNDMRSDAENYAYDIISDLVNERIAELVSGATVKTDDDREVACNGTLTLFELYRLYSSYVSYNASWISGGALLEFGSFEMRYNADSGFSYSPGAVTFLEPWDSDRPSKITIYSGESVVKEFTVHAYSGGFDYEPMGQDGDEKIMWLTDRTAICFALDHEKATYHTGSTDYDAILPVSIQMLYNYSNYPEKTETHTWGYTDEGDLLSQNSTGQNVVSGIYHLNGNYTIFGTNKGIPSDLASRQIATAESASCPTYVPEQNQDEVWSTVKWRILNSGSYQYATGGSIPMSDAQNSGRLSSFAFNPSTGYYNATFDVEPLFAKPYSVSYQFKDEVGNTVTLSGTEYTAYQTVKYGVGSVITVAAKPSVEGYDFDGDWIFPDGLTVTDGSFTMPEHDVVIKGKLKRHKHNVTYSVTGDVPDGYNVPDGETDVPYHESVTVASAPIYTGYGFSGWRMDGYTVTGTFLMPDQDVELVGEFTENRYTLEYAANAPGSETVSGMPAKEQNIRYTLVKDGGYTLASNRPSYPGYRFTGWKLNVTSEMKNPGNAVPFENFHNALKTATATAQWEEIPKYNVTYKVTKPDGATDISYTAPGSASYYEGTTDIAVAAVPAGGTDYDSARYAFNGWTPVPGVSIASGRFTMPGSDVEFQGTFTKRQYTVSYSVTGAPAGYTKPANGTFTVDESVDVAATPDMSAYPGYQFTGWKKDGEVVTTFTMPAGNVTLTGVFEKIPYTVTYEVENAPAGYRVPTDDAVYYVGDTVTAKSVPTVEGYTFTGWKYGGETVTTFTMPAANAVLKGVFEKTPYTVTYQVTGAPEGYAVPTDSTPHYFGDSVPAAGTPDMSAYPGYAFEGWKYGGEIVTTFTMPAANVVLQGVFTRKSFTVSYSVTGQPDGWTVPESHSELFGATVTPKDVPDYDTARYTFEGWKKDGVLLSGTFTMPAQNVTLTGEFTENDRITLKYDANRGNGSEIISTLTKSDYTQISETIADLPGTYTRTGYTFANKWNTNANGTGTDYTVGAAKEFTASTTLYAVWNENAYAIEYQDGGIESADIPSGASGLAYSTIKDGYQLSTAVPTATGYSFDCWNVNGTSYAPGATIPFTAFDNSQKKAVAVAQWRNWTYKVEYVPGAGHETASNMPKGRKTDGTVDPATHVQQFLLSNFRIAPYAMIDTTEPVDNGYTFIGWSLMTLDADGLPGQLRYDLVRLREGSASSLTLNENWFGNQDNDLTITATALWAKNYTLEYYDGETLLDGTQTEAYSEGFTGITIAKENLAGTSERIFCGWVDAGNVKYTKDQQVPKAKFDENTHTAKLYAAWESPSPVSYSEYIIRYHGNGTDGNYTDVDVVPESVPAQQTVSENDLMNGYTLKGEYGKDTAPQDCSGTNGAPMFDFVCWCLTPQHQEQQVRTSVTLADVSTENYIDVYAVWLRHVNVEYNKGDVVDNNAGNNGTGNDDTGNGNSAGSDTVVKYTEVFDLDIKTLRYKVKSIDELGEEFQMDNFVFDYWEVISTESPIIRYKGASGGAGEPARSGAGEGTEEVGVGGKLYPGDRLSLVSDVTLKAYWKPIVTLTYKANKGGPKEAVPDQENPVSYVSGQTFKVQSGKGLKKGDQVFDHWSTSENDESTGTVYEVDKTYTITANLILYAIYADAPSSGGNEFTVTYDANGGTGTTPTDSTKYSGGETVTVAGKGNLTRTDCTFKEWNTAKNGSGTGYSGDGTATFQMPASNVTLYAIWVDSSGNIVPSPGTGESMMLIIAAISLVLISALAVSAVMIRKRFGKA